MMKLFKTFFILLALAVVISSCSTGSYKNAKLSTEHDTVSYYLGIDVGKSLDATGIEDFNVDAFMKGLAQVINEEEIEVTDQDVKMYINQYFADLQKVKSDKNLEEGRAWLAENAKREEVITTESGLQYEVLEEGSGILPKPTDTVVVHYHGTLVDGRVFDSSIERGETIDFPLNRVIPGWTEGLQLMKEGAKYKFYLPTELAYGQNPRRGGIIEPNMALIFEVELIEVIKGPESAE